MSVADALQLMLAFGTFIVALIALIVELIKSQQKKGSLSNPVDGSF
ncbi:putative holin-like toxin [Limosilactobacillus fermentum]